MCQPVLLKREKILKNCAMSVKAEVCRVRCKRRYQNTEIIKMLSSKNKQSLLQCKRAEKRSEGSQLKREERPKGM